MLIIIVLVLWSRVPATLNEDSKKQKKTILRSTLYWTGQWFFFVFFPPSLFLCRTIKKYTDSLSEQCCALCGRWHCTDSFTCLLLLPLPFSLITKNHQLRNNRCTCTIVGPDKKTNDTAHDSYDNSEFIPSSVQKRALHRLFLACLTCSNWNSFCHRQIEEQSFWHFVPLLSLFVSF